MSRYASRKQWKRLYDTAHWKRIRQQRLTAEPLCRLCKDRFKRVTVATVCDHIIPHKGNEQLFYSYANTQSLCKPCHDTHKHRAEIGALERPEFDDKGYPV